MPLRYCVTRFACRVHTWNLPVGGCVAGLLAEYGSGGHALCVACARFFWCWFWAFWAGMKESSTQQKTPQRVGFNLGFVSGKG